MLARRLVSFVVVAVAAVWLGAGGAAADAGMRLSLKGYDPVAYFTLGQPTEGKEDFETVFDGARYRFASAEHMALFQGDPDKYAPQFAGACTNGLSQGVKVEANPELWQIVDGRLYVFFGKKVPDQMKTDPAPMIEKARENWVELKDAPFRKMN